MKPPSNSRRVAEAGDKKGADPASLLNQMEDVFSKQMDASENVNYYTGGRRRSSFTGSGTAGGGVAGRRASFSPGSSATSSGGNGGPAFGRSMTLDTQQQQQKQQQQQQQTQPNHQQPEVTREQLLQHIINPHFDEDSPAAEALRANAQVHVHKMSKVARGIKAQALKKVVGKRKSTRTGRGKPPRVPPSHQMVGGAGDHKNNEMPDMYGIEEGEEEESNNNYPSSGGLASGDSSSMEEQVRQVNSMKSSGTSKDGGGKSPKKGGDSPVKKRPPGDSLNFSLNAMKRSSVKALAPDGDAKDIPDDVVEGTMEAGREVMKSVDPHNILSVTRWRRKKRKGKEKKVQKSYVKGNVIDGQHELYAQSIAVMLGVRTSIARTNALITAEENKKRWIQKEDFLKIEKYEFRPDGSEHTPPHQLSHTFKFKDYAPVVFAYMRRLFGVNEIDFLLSVCGNANFIEFISNAKSGQFLFYSSDGKYMIKTMSNAESKFLRRILPDYFKHCCSNPNTMISKFFGMYRVKLYHLRKNVKFVIMNSVYYTDKPLQMFYDLKGSIHGRDAPGEAVLKDNDLRAQLPDGALAMAPEQRDRVRRQIIRDCNFMQKQGIMDYSMLVGVHHISPKPKDSHGNTRGAPRASVRRPSLAVRPLALSGSTDNHSVGGDSHGSHDLNMSVSGMHHSFTQTQNAQDNGNHQAPPMFDEYLDEDDNSYLEGSTNRPPPPVDIMEMDEDIEKKKLQTIEQIYWPFHQLYDIHGHRRMIPGPGFQHSSEDREIVKGYGIPSFVAPLSDRKDGGFMMDTTGLDMPMKYHNPRTGEQPYEGKIFYMGIIDVLQEYNSRKVVEAGYHMLEGKDALEASCVPPRDYAARFVKFFDMYSMRVGKSARGVLSSFKRSTRMSVRSFNRSAKLESQLPSEVAAGLERE